MFILSTLVIAVVAVHAQTPPCPPLELIYARATLEPPQMLAPGNFSGSAFEQAAKGVWSEGYGAAGHSLMTNISSLIPGAASFAGCPSEDAGISDMTNRLQTRSASCPSTKFVLGGHSQGGFVTARTLVRLPKEIKDKIIAVTSFGAPLCLEAYGIGARCVTYCHKSDEVCDDEGSVKSKGRCSDPLIEGPTSSAMMRRNEFANDDAAPQLNPEECTKPARLQPTGLDVTPAQPHLSYNSDGRYIREAACFVYRQFTIAAS
ncbi:carbohydrate esterase family 5 protein [Aulographum hederae CBS 113979]|uniref:cutinase n=1 Tax=Aulographum hederae CBS 113979 TaxID=1176131 RepID=A0A6G1GIU7_9PEZI|nr:carbohydrate esterase family 5 protein [Aulographum hederae CBS 113979]